MRVGGPVVWLMLTLAVLSATTAHGVVAQSTGLPFASTQIEVDDIFISIELRQDGDAVWTVEHRSRLDTADRRDAFESQMQDINDHPGEYTTDLEQQLSGTADVAADETGRPMGITNVSVHAEIRQLPREYGVITYGFVWEGFAAVDGGDIQAGGVLSGMFLDEDTRLRIEWPEPYGLVDVRPTPDETEETSVTWAGPTNFGSSEPELTVSRSTSLVVSDTVPGWVLGIGVVVVALGGSVAYWNYRGRPLPGDDERRDERLTVADDAAEPGILTNEEQVLELLETHGGRLKQQQVVAELGWSETKTSEVISEMHQEGLVDRYRLGRENVILLPEESDV